MQHSHITFQPSSKFTSWYTKLLHGYPPHVISPNDAPGEFWANLLSLDLDREWLANRLNQVTKDDCLGKLKVRTHFALAA
jgi:hypothetical protein